MTKISAGLKMNASLIEALSFSLELPAFFEEAICVDAEAGLFDGESLRDVLEAKRICTNCPIQAMCLEWATQTQEAGVWGGLTPEERKNLRGGTSPADIGELRLLETNRDRLLSDPASVLAAEFEVAERTIYRWRKDLRQSQKAS